MALMSAGCLVQSLWSIVSLSSMMKLIEWLEKMKASKQNDL
jgi:hypothetical protein